MHNPFDSGYFDEHELEDAGFKALGKNVRIARNCTILGLENIAIGDRVRIDPYTSIIANGTGSLSIGCHVHIGSYSMLSAGEGIRMEDFSGLSQGVRIYTRTDDYSGEFLTNPTVPSKFTGVTRGPVVLGRHVVIGSGTVILPNVSLGEGVAVGAVSLVTRSLDPWGVYFGSPVRRLKSRSRQLLELEAQLRREEALGAP